MRMSTFTALAGTAVAALALLGAPSAGAAAGVVVVTGPDGDTPIPFPADDQCFPTPGASAARNYSVADAFFFTDAACTTGSEAGSASAFKDFSGAFESFRVRSPAS